MRGFRIELSEIESKTLNISGIRQAAAEMRTSLAGTSLAEYMVPDTYMRLDAMPMTPNLKIKRKALPTPEIKRVNDYVAPEGETETLFTQIFSQVLNIEQVGATDDFFEIGGTSFSAIKVIVEASKRGAHIVFNDLFNLKTPKAIAYSVSDKVTLASHLGDGLYYNHTWMKDVARSNEFGFNLFHGISFGAYYFF